MGFWEDNWRKVSFSSHNIKGTYYQHDFVAGISLNPSVEVVFVRLLHSKVTHFFLLSILYSLGGSCYTQSI